MKHLEVSKKIKLTKPVEAPTMKQALIDRLEKILDIESLTDGTDNFSLTGTTGSSDSITRHARLDLDVSLQFDDDDTARILISGTARTARSLVVLYWALFLVMLFVGLLPGSIETGADKSDAMDALVFVIFGIFIAMDINNKLKEPRENLTTALESLNTRFG